MDNRPFIFGTTASGENFTDRVEETSHLLANLTHGINTILISPRRWGKTSLVQKVGKMAQSEKLKVLHLDIFACRNEDEFYQSFASAVLKQTSSKYEEWIDSAKSFLSRLAPTFSFGPDPNADFSMSLNLKPKQENVEDVLMLPESIAKKKGINIVICIDEFQQIAEFSDSKTFQKRLRSVWQLQECVSYCLFGSKKHLMNELFAKSSYPFYKFGDVVNLPKIPTEDWIAYICERFKSTGKCVSKEIAERICKAVDNNSSYVQQLAWLLWTHTTKVADEEGFALSCQEIIDHNSFLFEKQTENLTANQMNFLLAIADGVHNGFSSQAVIEKYHFGSSANINIIKQSLFKKELIDVEGKDIVLADPVMSLWLKTIK